MNRKSFLMLAAAMVLGVGAVRGVGHAQAQPAASSIAPRGAGATSPVYDPAQLPQVKGKVAQYSLTPRGDVDGLILADGTEVHVPPFISTQLVFAVRPGDDVTIHGLKARVLPMVAARSITNDATGATVLVAATQGPARPSAGTALEAEGKVAAVLHTPRGDANGVRLEDGTIVRLPPPEAKRLAETLAVGRSVAVRGEGYAGAMGRVIAARQLGETKDSLKDVAGPRAGDRHFGPGMRHGWHGHDGERGPGMGGPRMGRENVPG